MRLPTFVDFAEVRRIPLTDILSRYGLLDTFKRSGTQLYGCCPIHNGSNRRQFAIEPNKNIWKCFGDCAAGGGTLEFVAAKEKIAIKEAAELIAQWFTIAPINPLAGSPQPRRKSMSGLPSHKAFVVEDREEGEKDEDNKPFWTRVGSAWPHKDGKGLNVVIAAGVAVSGRLVLREYTEADAKEEEEKKVKRKR